ncbi:MAG TPA: hypothetical protein VNQ79_21425 [Blastocatellia bacterium]|nr:hypothetical protein [Blastocatellia bacterium]
MYDYRNDTGALLYQVCRFEPKSFRQRRPDGNGGWLWRLEGARRVPYRLPELIAADPGEIVFIVEGEKDVDALRALAARCRSLSQGAVAAGAARKGRRVRLAENWRQRGIVTGAG